MLKVLIAFATIATLVAPSFAGERENVLQVVEYFYQGDHTGSKKYRELSLHPKGAYRYSDENGQYVEDLFTFEEGHADTSYKEEVLSVDIYQDVALVRLRLAFEGELDAEYKLMILHKLSGKWLITSISWGMGVTL
jgi:hypothetical protein